MAPDEPLLDRALADDREAFESLTSGCRDRIYRYLVGMTGEPALAEDLLQESFRRAWEKRASFERRSKFSTWLYQIAVNLLRQYFRDEANRVAPADPQVLDARAIDRRRSVLSSVTNRETATLIALAIDRLPPSLREAFVLHAVEHLPYEEIAAITGVSADTLYVRSHRARELLRQLLGSAVDSFWSNIERRP